MSERDYSYIDAIGEDLGVQLKLTVNLKSAKLSQLVKVTYSMGINTVPTMADIDRVIVSAIEDANKSQGADDFRLTHLGDFGWARQPEVEWPPHPDIARPGDIVGEGA